MAYVTRDELRALLDPRNASTPTAADLSDARLDAIIAGAEAEINARLSARYTVPITVSPVPALLKRITLDYAAYRAQLEFSERVDLEGRDPYALRYQAAQRLLNDIVYGLAHLTKVEPNAAEAVGKVFNQIDKPLFSIEDFDLTKVYGPQVGPRGRWEVYDA